MKTSDFDYYLPENLIAQSPLEKRDSSRLLVLDKETGEIEHKHFTDIVDYLSKDDILVLNNTKVMPARLYGTKDTKAVVEVLLLKEKEKDMWECLTKPAKRIKLGTVVTFKENLLKAECVGIGKEGIRFFKFIYKGIFNEILDQLGEMPLPPYIHKQLKDGSRYQTIYAKELGSAAAPTAGLHFTKDLLSKIQKKGVKVVYITLHVGLGTFRPVNVDDVTKHKMHSEFYKMDQETADILNNKKGSIISVGTTTTRTLETIMKLYGKFKECSGWTDIFIYPGFEFKGIDKLITNFHLPKSTLIMLVSALAGKENIMKAYKEAVKKEYRFFSFGDSMFIK